MDEQVGRTLASAQEMLEIARGGGRDFAAGGERKLSGLYQAVSSARSVTFVLQGMRHHVAGFDDWYGPITAELGADPVCKWFVTVRNRVEKEGTAGPTEVRVKVDYFGPGSWAGIPAPPPGAVGMFVGDRLGRSGWKVQLPDGTEQIVYFDLPSHIGTSQYLISDAPDGRDVQELLDHYFDKLQSVIDRARGFAADKVWDT